MSEEESSVAETTNDATHGATATDTDTSPVSNTAPAESETSATIFSAAQGSTEEAQKSDGETAADGEKNANGETQEQQTEKVGAPETYEEFSAPNGATLDSEVAETFKTVAKELDLTQVQAQSVIDRLAPKMMERTKVAIDNLSKQWADASAKDPEIGGSNWQQSCANIARIRDTFAKNEDGSYDKDIAEFMNSPLGNHPGVLKLLSRAGRAFGEASFPNGSRKPEERAYTATQFYEDAKRH